LRGHKERQIELALAPRRKAVPAQALACAVVALGAVVVAIASVPAIAVASTAAATPSVAHAWGFNNDGELGNGTTESSDVPVEVIGLHGVAAVAGGGRHSLALLQDGTVMAWGENFDGQLGNGSTASSDVPVPVSGLSEVTAVSAGRRYSLALLKSGKVMAWGYNEGGQLGDGGTTSSDVPVAVSNLSEVAAISAGADFSLARLKDGRVMAWGENLYGQLGDGSREGSDVPVAVNGLTGVTAISAGSRHSLALLSSGAVVAWGGNKDGQLGDGSEAESDVPVAVSNLRGVFAIAAGQSHSLAVVGAGAVMAWGANAQGQLGDGSYIGPEQCGVLLISACSKVPVAASGVSEVTGVSAHGNHSMALLAHRTVMAWGQNASGELGNGTTGPEACGTGSCSASPVTVCQEGPQIPCPTGPALADVKSIAAGEAHSLAIVEPPAPASFLPELGRCVRVASGGAFRGTSPHCTALSSTHTGHFEWLSGPGPKAKFKDTVREPKLETLGGVKLSCTAALLEGEYTGYKTETIGRLVMQGCRDVTANTSCQTDPLEPGLVESVMRLEGELGFIKSGATPSVGWDLKPMLPGAPLVSFECGSGGGAATRALEGAVIGRATPIDTMAAGFELVYKQRGGRQIPESFETGLTQLLTLTTMPVIGTTASEQAGLMSKGTLTDEEPFEIKAKA
jgi:alpha-tubulin suppressor-like RCC1 family protein